MKMRRALMIACAALSLGCSAASGADLPAPLCAAVPGPDAGPQVNISRTPLATPPRGVDWITARTTVLIAVTGALHAAGAAEAVAARFGKVSRLGGLMYWSASERRLEQLIITAQAVDGPGLDRPRSDYAASDLAPGRPVYFSEQDNRAKGPTLYKMTAREITSARVVVDIENASPIGFMMFRFFGPGDLRSTYILERTGEDLWTYCGITGAHESPLVRLRTDRDKSYINRALAFFSFIADTRPNGDMPWAK